VVLHHEHCSGLHPDEELAMQWFLPMADQISTLEGDIKAGSESSVDRFLSGMSRMRRQNPDSYRMLRQKLLEELRYEPAAE
jgi:hypothetical protein